MWTRLIELAADPSFGQWSQIGIGALIAAPAYAVVAVLWKDRKKCEAEVKELNDKATSRERELADRLAPLLAEAARILSSAPAQFEQALRTTRTSSEADQLIDKLSKLVGEHDGGPHGS